MHARRRFRPILTRLRKPIRYVVAVSVALFIVTAGIRIAGGSPYLSPLVLCVVALVVTLFAFYLYAAYPVSHLHEVVRDSDAYHDEQAGIVPTAITRRPTPLSAISYVFLTGGIAFLVCLAVRIGHQLDTLSQPPPTPPVTVVVTPPTTTTTPGGATASPSRSRGRHATSPAPPTPVESAALADGRHTDSTATGAPPPGSSSHPSPSRSSTSASASPAPPDDPIPSPSITGGPLRRLLSQLLS